MIEQTHYTQKHIKLNKMWYNWIAKKPTGEKMKPTAFKQQNCVYAEHQQEYLPLPSHKDSDGVVTTCWYLSFRERIQVLFTGKLYNQIMTFNHPLQPQRPSVKNPLETNK
jgi:hypothetical protein